MQRVEFNCRQTHPNTSIINKAVLTHFSGGTVHKTEIFLSSIHIFRLQSYFSGIGYNKHETCTNIFSFL